MNVMGGARRIEDQFDCNINQVVINRYDLIATGATTEHLWPRATTISSSHMPALYTNHPGKEKRDPTKATST